MQGFGPAKNIVLRNPDFVKWAHAEGMTVTPYTFRASDAAKSGFKDVAEEMSHYLYKLDVDALFTDNPGQVSAEVTSTRAHYLLRSAIHRSTRFSSIVSGIAPPPSTVS